MLKLAFPAFRSKIVYRYYIMRFETTKGSDVRLSHEAAVLALAHLSDGGMVPLRRVPEISDDEFRKLCTLRLPIGEHGTYIPPDQADTTFDLV